MVKSEKLDKLAPGMRHQGVAALAAPIAFQTLDDVLPVLLLKARTRLFYY